MRDDICAEGSIYPLEVEYTKKSSAVAEMGDRARTKWAEKWGGASVYLSVAELGPQLTQCGSGRGLPPYQMAF